MRTWIVALIAISALLALILSFCGDDQVLLTNGAPSHSVTSNRFDTRQHVGQNDLGSRPSLDVSETIVAIDRGPRKPNERDSTYRYRRKVAKDFDDFARAARITNEQERKILLALYDYQQNAAGLRSSHDDAPHIKTEDWFPLAEENARIVYNRLDAILTPRQRELWYKLCSGCVIYLDKDVITLQHGDEKRP